MAYYEASTGNDAFCAPQQAYGDYGVPALPYPAYGDSEDVYNEPQYSADSQSYDYYNDRQRRTIYDTYDEATPLQPPTDRVAEAAAGRARLSLPGPGSQHRPFTPSYIDNPRSIPQRPDFHQFAYQGPQHEGPSSNTGPMTSSPTVRASQRQLESFVMRPSKLASVHRGMRPSHSRPYDADDHEIGQAIQGYEQDLVDETTEHDQVVQPAPVWVEDYSLPSASKTHAAPTIVQGIQLVPIRTLGDRFRTLYHFPVFNAMQSKCFPTAFESDHNLVLSSPTGSGKTVILELAICRTILGFPDGHFKIVYQAPTKALCSERMRDWSQKFASFGLKCAEMTGDSTPGDMRSVQSATIIIATPEKWDSMTRKWKDHEKLVRMVKLFLIDEVHILKETRGATLEAVVSRMNTVSSQVRIVALSATVPNSDDIAAWLGRDPSSRHLPAVRHCFGEEFRPVKLQKHVVGYQANSNDFAFEKALDSKLPDVIAKYSHKKPIMVFCVTRKACISTAKMLATWYEKSGPRARYWEAPRRRLTVSDRELQSCTASGVAFHHGGMDGGDRLAVEQGFLGGDISVICCTSTLAVGVNLPCHFVILKNTVTWQESGMKEYSDLEVMQMLGRAGRPQFDTSAVAVIMTRQEKVRLYEKMVTGQEVLESCLHLNLIDHLNAEIGLGTVTDASSAKKWLMGTFLYVRMKANPNYYRLEGDTGGGSLDDRLDRICSKDLGLLQDHELISGEQKLRTTEFGEAMARYYVNFATMRVLMSLPQKARVSDILAVLAQAAEFHDLRFRAGEKQVYKSINRHPSIKFPIPVNLDLPAHKVSLLLQAELGGVNIEDPKHQSQSNIEKSIIFQHVSRLIRCIIDCQLHLEDSVAARNALMLARSLGSRCWDDSPMQMKQLQGIGPVYAHKLVNAGIRSIDELQYQEPHRIEGILGKNPPWGTRFLDQVKAFPRLRVSLSSGGSPVFRPEAGISIQLKAEIGFMNEKVPIAWRGKPIYVCFLAETSDGRKAHFVRVAAKRLGSGQDIMFIASLKTPTQSIACYVMCDEIAGTQREAMHTPKIEAALFARLKPEPEIAVGTHKISGQGDHRIETMNSKKKRMFVGATTLEEAERTERRVAEDAFSDEDLEDSDMMSAGKGVSYFRKIDEIEHELGLSKRSISGERNRPPQQNTRQPGTPAIEPWHPRRLENGNWECNHKCKDKTQCKHTCCREGTESKPKPPKAQAAAAETKKQPESNNKIINEPKMTQSTLKAVIKKRGPSEYSSSGIDQVDLCRDFPKPQRKASAPNQLQSLHAKSQLNPPPSTMTSVDNQAPQYSYSSDKPPSLSFLPPKMADVVRTSSDYGNDWMNLDDIGGAETNLETSAVPGEVSSDEQYDCDDPDLGDVMTGLADSQDLRDPGFVSASGQDASRIFKPQFKDKEPLVGDTSSSSLPDVGELTSKPSLSLQPAKASYERPSTPVLGQSSKRLKSHHFPGHKEVYLSVDQRAVEPHASPPVISAVLTAQAGVLERSASVVETREPSNEEVAETEKAAAQRWLEEMGWANGIEIV